MGNKQNPLLLQTTPTKAPHPRKRELKTPIGVVYVDNAPTLSLQSPEIQAWAGKNEWELGSALRAKVYLPSRAIHDRDSREGGGDNVLSCVLGDGFAPALQNHHAHETK
jgi:hypothetical protein